MSSAATHTAELIVKNCIARGAIEVGDPAELAAEVTYALSKALDAKPWIDEADIDVLEAEIRTLFFDSEHVEDVFASDEELARYIRAQLLELAARVARQGVGSPRPQTPKS